MNVSVTIFSRIAPVTHRTWFLLKGKRTKLYEVLSNKDFNKRQKKTFVYSLEGITEEVKDNIWTAYIEKTYESQRGLLHAKQI